MTQVRKLRAVQEVTVVPGLVAILAWNNRQISVTMETA